MLINQNLLKPRMLCSGGYMQTKALVLALLAWAPGGVAAAQQPGIPVAPNSIYTSAEGKYESAPDTALVQFNISVQEEKSRAAYDRAQQRAQHLRDILRSNGIDPSAAEIGFFSIQPVYDWKQPQRKLVGYRVNTNVSLKLKDFTKIG